LAVAMARLAVWAAAAAAAAAAQGFALKHRLDFTFDVPPGVDTIKVRLMSDCTPTRRRLVTPGPSRHESCTGLRPCLGLLNSVT
jgi:hypothetical protein